MLEKNKKVLLIGGGGTLGSSIIKSNTFKNIDFPTRSQLDLLDRQSIRRFLKKKYNLIINCAAFARMKKCEKNPSEAVLINIIGTFNLVNEIIHCKKKIKLIHLSTDGVYPSIKGNYSEKSLLKPYNVYGWTKLCSENIVKMLNSYIIIRTRFFDKSKIKFRTAATDIFTSMIEVTNLVNEIKYLSSISFNGIINIGKKKTSDFINYKKYKSKIKPCKRKKIVKNINFEIAKDASMNLNLFKSLKKKL